MGAAWRITSKDLLLRLRDKSAIIVGLVVPLVLAFIFNLIFSGSLGEGTLTTLGYVDEDGGQVAARLGEVLSALDEQGTIGVEEVPDRATLRSRVEDGDLPAGIVVPAGFSDAALSGMEASLEVVGDVESQTTMSIARGIADGFATAIEDGQRAVAAVMASEGGPPDPAGMAAVAEAATGSSSLLQISPVRAADRLLDPTTFFAAGMAVFFVFFLVQVGVTGLIDEERDGTLTRLHAAPIPRWSVLLGKVLTSFVLGMVTLTVLAVATSVLMGADWGEPLGLALLFAAVTLAATSLVGVVGALARTPEGAGNLVGVMAVAMGMLGGTFFPVGMDNRLLEVASMATPHSWFMRGVADLRTGDVMAAAASYLALGVFAVVAGTVAMLLMARRYR